MSHPSCDLGIFRYASGMSRLALIVLVTACSAGSQDAPASQPTTGGGEKIAVPGGEGMAKGPAPGGGNDDRAKLHPAEGTLAIASPSDAKAGTESTATITVKPGAGYHVNTEYPIKLTLTATDGVAIAKTELAAGGHDKSKGDADAFDEQNLTFSVKLTPAKTGSYTVNGSFKFAVCDKDQCLPKREQIAIVVAAK
jgi:hypothetical protein